MKGVFMTPYKQTRRVSLVSAMALCTTWAIAGCGLAEQPTVDELVVDTESELDEADAERVVLDDVEAGDRIDDQAAAAPLAGCVWDVGYTLREGPYIKGSGSMSGCLRLKVFLQM